MATPDPTSLTIPQPYAAWHDPLAACPPALQAPDEPAEPVDGSRSV
jgi:hypothetical protein